MTLTLAATWNPRGETGRFLRLIPEMEQVYSAIYITLPPETPLQLLNQLKGLPLALSGRLTLSVTSDWACGRHQALQGAHHIAARYTQYADLDRLLRWVETRPEEWRSTTALIQRSDYLVIGRTPAAYATHPRALVETEAISNQVISYLVGQPLDVSAGSKGFMIKAIDCIMANCQPGRALGADGDWTVTLHRAGFRIGYTEVDGLDWESADRYQDQAVDGSAQRRAADQYDRDARHWQYRVSVAAEIVQAGLEAAKKEIVPWKP